MNRIYKLISFFPIFILGCTPNVIEENKVKQKIDSLDMDIFSNRGVKIYSITSPYSSFDKIKQKFQLQKTIINIFNGEKIKYIIKSDVSTLSKNNKTIPLNPIKTPRDFGRDSFSSFKKKCAKRDPLKGVVLIKIAAK